MCKMHGLTSKSNRAKTDVVDHIFVVVMFFCSYVVKCVLLLSRLEKIAYKRLLAMPSGAGGGCGDECGGVVVSNSDYSVGGGGGLWKN